MIHSSLGLANIEWNSLLPPLVSSIALPSYSSQVHRRLRTDTAWPCVSRTLIYHCLDKSTWTQLNLSRILNCTSHWYRWFSFTFSTSQINFSLMQYCLFRDYISRFSPLTEPMTAQMKNGYSTLCCWLKNWTIFRFSYYLGLLHGGFRSLMFAYGDCWVL